MQRLGDHRQRRLRVHHARAAGSVTVQQDQAPNVATARAGTPTSTEGESYDSHALGDTDSAEGAADPGGDDRVAGPVRLRLGRLRRRGRQRPARPCPRRSSATSRPRRASRSGCSTTRLKALRIFDRKPMPNWGSNLDGIDFDNIKYFVRSTEKQAATWDDLPEDIKNTYDKLGIPEAEKQRLVSGVAAQYESEVVYHQIREDLEEQGVIFLDTDTGLREHPELFQEYFGTRDPGRGQQVLRAEHRGVVGRLVHLRAEGRARRHPAAGLLPDQHREHGPVRADADHRRRGRLRALRRGLHRADLQVGLAALGGGRDHRQEGRPLPLHHHPELVEQRLQPGHQAGQGRGGRDHGVGRRQHRLQGDHEVPGGLDDRRVRQGRGALDRLRRRGPAPGHRREDAAPGAAHLLAPSCPSRWPAAAAGRPTAAWSR